MAFKCKIGIHSWNGCKCSECGKTRDKQHDWSKDCEKCSICASTRVNEHDWSMDCNTCAKCGKRIKESHVWNRDKCEKCGKNIWESDDPKIRLSAIENIIEESILFKLAKDDKDNDVSLAAIRKISNQSFLSEYSKMGESYTSHQIESLKKIDDQKLLIEIVIFGKNNSIRCDAVEKITDQNFLKEIVINSGYDRLIRETAVRKISDQVFLYNIAKNENVYFDIRCSSILNITDQNMLKDIVFSVKAKDIDKEIKLRNLAVDQISDEEIFQEIVKESKELGVIERVFGYITNQDFLNEFAKNVQYDVKKRIIASERLTDQNLLQDFILNSSPEGMEWGFKSALDRINNQTLFIKIINDPFHKFSNLVVSSAIKKVEDQNALKDIFTKSALNDQLKAETLQRINDQEFLVEIVKANYEDSVRIIGISNILNPSQLLECVKNDKSGLILNSAASRIYNLNEKTNKYTSEKEIIKYRLFEDKQIHIYPEKYLSQWQETSKFLDEIGLSTSNQIWKTDNLNVTCFQNGDEIFEAESKEKWIQLGNEKKPAYCQFNFDIKDDHLNGKLYNWYAATDQRGLCPKGWHIPTIDELFILEQFVKNPNYSVENVIMKEFSLIIAGYSYEDGVFSGTNQSSKFWCQTNDRFLRGAFILIKFNHSFGSTVLHVSKENNWGYSILCIKDKFFQNT